MDYYNYQSSFVVTCYIEDKYVKCMVACECRGDETRGKIRKAGEATFRKGGHISKQIEKKERPKVSVSRFKSEWTNVC